MLYLQQNFANEIIKKWSHDIPEDYFNYPMECDIWKQPLYAYSPSTIYPVMNVARRRQLRDDFEEAIIKDCVISFAFSAYDLKHLRETTDTCNGNYVMETHDKALLKKLQAVFPTEPLAQIKIVDHRLVLPKRYAQTLENLVISSDYLPWGCAKNIGKLKQFSFTRMGGAISIPDAEKISGSFFYEQLTGINLSVELFNLLDGCPQETVAIALNVLERTPSIKLIPGVFMKLKIVEISINYLLKRRTAATVERDFESVLNFLTESYIAIFTSENLLGALKNSCFCFWTTCFMIKLAQKKTTGHIKSAQDLFNLVCDPQQCAGDFEVLNSIAQELLFAKSSGPVIFTGPKPRVLDNIISSNCAKHVSSTEMKHETDASYKNADNKRFAEIAERVYKIHTS